MSKERFKQNQILTEESVKDIRNWGENVFATAVTPKEHLLVKYQIPVGGKRIDFLVKNLKMNGKSRGKLIEVTSTSINKAYLKNPQKHAMENEGLPFTILFGENLMKIDACNRKRKSSGSSNTNKT